MPVAVPIPPIVLHKMTAVPVRQEVAAMGADNRLGAMVVVMRAFAGYGAGSEDQAAESKKNRLDAIRDHGGLRRQQVNERLTSFGAVQLHGNEFFAIYG
ncbi:hypothetical protein E2F50_16775 [Rhizobium deserti]|uniref:Uncharacterized protein n=1 Tax=Rhizobium deserti TaxID=2547961 RepID=A0A4R5UG39_9HYPH|nr:hypothetical protein [Rhizobium deserti]TDK34491.1 hypothetical protein E2F50_16775 [Rhizobium deserti]